MRQPNAIQNPSLAPGTERDRRGGTGKIWIKSEVWFTVANAHPHAPQPPVPTMAAGR